MTELPDHLRDQLLEAERLLDRADEELHEASHLFHDAEDPGGDDAGDDASE